MEDTVEERRSRTSTKVPTFALPKNREGRTWGTLAQFKVKDQFKIKSNSESARNCGRSVQTEWRPPASNVAGGSQTRPYEIDAKEKPDATGSPSLSASEVVLKFARIAQPNLIC